MKLSIVVICHNMAREARRTLFTLKRDYQRKFKFDYEVIVLDNGSEFPLSTHEVSQFGPEFRYEYYETDSPSPAAAVNHGVSLADGTVVAIMIDGARMLSPGCLEMAGNAFLLSEQPVVSTLAWHIGPKIQNESVLDGYCQAVEDELLKTIDWRSDGYTLFDISTLAGSSRPGFFGLIAESNFICVTRDLFTRLGGYSEAFASKGGGLVNLDFFKRAVEDPGTTHWQLLGEGTFHQFHGGVATNVPSVEHPWKEFHDEYLRIRGERYTKPQVEPCYLGRMRDNVRRFIAPFQ